VPRRRLILLAFVIALTGCGSSRDVPGPQEPVAISAPGRIDPLAKTYRPTRGCTYVPAAQGAGGVRAIAAPIPEVSARIDGWTLRVQWQFQALPASCRPKALLVTANSVYESGNMATRPGAGGPIAVRGATGSLRFDAPFLDLPPYEARISSLNDRGIRSAVTTVPVSGSRPGCTDRQPAAVCIAAAQRLFARCITGAAPRERCHPKAWRTQPPLPIRPLRGVTSRSLETSLRATVEGMRSPQAVPSAVSCAAPPSCEVTWATPGQPATRFTVRYRMSGSEVTGSSGCWIAARQSVAHAPADHAALEVMQGWGNAFSQPSACASWPKR
jgi:hypothetical protein